MAIAVADAALAATGTLADPRALSAARPAGRMGQAAVIVEGAALALVPLLLGPLPPSAAQALAVLGTVLVLFLLDLGEAARSTGSKALPVLLLLAGAGLAASLGEGLPLLTLLFLLLRLCARHLGERSLMMTSVLAAAVAACRIDAGSLATGQPGGSWLLLAAGSLAVFATLSAARAQASAPGPGAKVRVPTRASQLQELLLVALLAASVAANFALLGSEARVQADGLVGAFLPAPFLILGLFRCAQLAFAAGGLEPRLPSLRDPLTALAAFGWAAGLVAAPWLPSLP